MLNHVIEKAGEDTETTIVWDLRIGKEGSLILYMPDIINGNVISINKEGTIYHFNGVSKESGLSFDDEGKINIREEW